MVTDRDLLARLEDWYARNCDEDWEHQYGVKIDTLDNPGWSLEIDLTDTKLEGRPFDEVREDTTDDNWYRCWVEANVFNGRGGARNLNDMLRVFMRWLDLDASVPKADLGRME